MLVLTGEREGTGAGGLRRAKLRCFVGSSSIPIAGIEPARGRQVVPTNQNLPIVTSLTSLPADDRLAILDLMARYYLANDAKDVDRALAECTSDAVISGDFEMRATHQREDLQKIYDGEPGKKRHLFLNPIFLSATADSVRLQHLMLVIEASLVPATVATSKVTDELRRVDGQWKIAEHRIEVDDSAKWMVQAGQKVQEVVDTVKEKLS